MQKKRLVSMTAAVVMALSSAAAVVPASADTAPVTAASAIVSVEASTATLKFNPNGGTVVGAKKKTYKKGKAIGVLPNAKKANYVFDGWFTKKTGGKRITYSSKLAKCTNKTFYAHWKKADQPHLKYKFSNSYEGFGYKYDPYDYDNCYHTPLARYKYVFDKNYANWIFKQVGVYEDYNGNKHYVPWGGNCFGMSASSSFNASGKTNIKTFNKKATFTRNLGVKNKSSKLNLTVGQYCEAVQLTQFNWGIQEQYDDHASKYNDIVKNVKKVQNGKGLPVVIAVMTGNSGHALLGYKFKKVDKYTDRIYVYDSNWPEDKNTYITLYKNSSGSYYNFSYESYDKISYFTTATVYNVWSHRGKKSASGLTDQQRIDFGVDAARATVYDAAGNVYCTINNGEVEGGDAFTFKICADKLDPKFVPTIVSLPAGEYTIKTDDGSVAKSSVYYNGKTVESEGSIITVKAANGALVLK